MGIFLFIVLGTLVDPLIWRFISNLVLRNSFPLPFNNSLLRYNWYVICFFLLNEQFCSFQHIYKDVKPPPVFSFRKLPSCQKKSCIHRQCFSISHSSQPLTTANLLHSLSVSEESYFTSCKWNHTLGGPLCSLHSLGITFLQSSAMW